MDSTFEQQVRQRAYFLWLRDAGGRGQIDYHWFQAVRDTLAEADGRITGRAGGSPRPSEPYADGGRVWTHTRVAEHT